MIKLRLFIICLLSVSGNIYATTSFLSERFSFVEEDSFFKNDPDEIRVGYFLLDELNKIFIHKAHNHPRVSKIANKYFLRLNENYKPIEGELDFHKFELEPLETIISGDLLSKYDLDNSPEDMALGGFLFGVGTCQHQAFLGAFLAAGYYKGPISVISLTNGFGKHTFIKLGTGKSTVFVDSWQGGLASSKLEFNEFSLQDYSWLKTSEITVDFVINDKNREEASNFFDNMVEKFGQMRDKNLRVVSELTQSYPLKNPTLQHQEIDTDDFRPPWLLDLNSI